MVQPWMMLNLAVRGFCVWAARVFWRLGWLMRISCFLSTSFLSMRVAFNFSVLRVVVCLFCDIFNGLLICYTISPPLAFGCFLFLSFCSTDEDTAEYLYDVLSSASDNTSPWLTQERHVVVGAIQGALEGLRGIGKVYEERVAEALATLQLPVPPAM